MKAKEIVEYAKKCKYILWVDDKIDAELTPDYIEKNTIAIVGDIDYGILICDRLHEKERSNLGRALTRFRISGPSEYVCSEDLSEEQAKKIIGAMNIADKEKIMADFGMKK